MKSPANAESKRAAKENAKTRRGWSTILFIGIAADNLTLKIGGRTIIASYLIPAEGVS
jgi:hypothetical protein